MRSSEKLGVENGQFLEECPKTKRKNRPGKWTDSRIKDALRQVANGNKHFPTDREIRAKGFGCLLQRFWKTKGLREKIAKELNLELREVTKVHLKTKKRTQKWALESAKQTIMELVKNNQGFMPTQQWFNKNGYGGLNAWICKKYGGVTNFVQVIGGGIKMRRSKRRRCDISRKATKTTQRTTP